MRRLPCLLLLLLPSLAFSQATANSVYAVAPGFEGQAGLEAASHYVRALGFDTLLFLGDFSRQADKHLPPTQGAVLASETGEGDISGNIAGNAAGNSAALELGFRPPELTHLDYSTRLAAAAHKAGLRLLLTLPTPPGGFAAETADWLVAAMQATGADGFLLSDISLLRPDQWAQIRQRLQVVKSDVLLFAFYPAADADYVEGISAEPAAYSAAGFQYFLSSSTSADLRAAVRSEAWNAELFGPESDDDPLLQPSEFAWSLDLQAQPRILNRIFESPDMRLATALSALFLGPRLPILRYGTEFPLDGPEGQAGDFPLLWQIPPRFARLVRALNDIRANNPALLESPKVLASGQGWTALAYPGPRPLVLVLNFSASAGPQQLELNPDLIKSAGARPALLEWLGKDWLAAGTNEAYTKFANPGAIALLAQDVDTADLATAREADLPPAAEFAALPLRTPGPSSHFLPIELAENGRGLVEITLSPFRSALYALGPEPERQPEPVYFIVSSLLLVGLVVWGSVLRRRGRRRLA